MEHFPLEFTLKDGTTVKVYKEDEDCFEFYLTRLNSEKHNFLLTNGQIEESYETRFDELQKEADAARQEILQLLGLQVLRIKTELVEHNLPTTLQLIRDEIRSIRQNENNKIPSPILGEGKGGGA